MNTAFRKALVTWKLTMPETANGHNAIDTIEEAVGRMRKQIERYQRAKRPIKFSMSLYCDFVQATDESIITFPPAVLVTEQLEVDVGTNLDTVFSKCIQQLIDRVAAYQENGSGWTVHQLKSVDTTLWNLNPLRGGTFFPLPKWIQNTRCVVNVRNSDNECFRHAVMAGLYTPEHSGHRVGAYQQFYDALDAPNFTGLEFPLKVKDIATFERLNRDISINVYGLEESSTGSFPDGDEEDAEVEDAEVEDAEDSDVGESTLSGSDSEESSDEEPTAEDLQFLDEEEYANDPSFYRHVNTQIPAAPTSEGSEQARGHIYPLRIAPDIRPRHVNLLCVEDPLADGQFHYCTIRNFSGLMRKQYNRSGSNTLHFCYRCLHGFYAKRGERGRESCSTLQDHLRYCTTQRPQRISYPKNQKMFFKNVHKMMKAEVVGYADFECTLPCHSSVSTKVGVCTPSDEPATTMYQSHEPVSYLTHFVADRPGILPGVVSEPGFQYPQMESHVGTDCVEHMIDYCVKVARECRGNMFPAKPLVMTEEDAERHESEKSCHICEMKLEGLRHIVHAHRPTDDLTRCNACVINQKLAGVGFVEHIPHSHKKGQKKTKCKKCKHNANSKVRDHDHVSGAYRGAAHSACNLAYRIKNWTMPVFLHNLTSYDGHVILKSVTKKYRNVRIIPSNMEKFIALQVESVVFLDSLKFAGKSLEKLVETLDDEDFIETKKMFGVTPGPRPPTVHHAHPEWENPAECAWCQTNLNEERIQQLFQKSYFPYDYFDSIDRLQDTSLPGREKFFNRLTDKEMTVQQEDHAKRVWELQGCRTFRDYHDYYLKTDVTLLADFFEKFRRICMTSYRLDPANYFSTPMLAMDASLKVTGVELTLLDNESMYTFFESAIRGGISQISLRHAAANTPLAPNYNPDADHQQLIYLDSNNLYGKAMSQSLPVSHFRWLSREEISSLHVPSLDDASQMGYALEVDLIIPDELHDKLNDLPPAPQNITIGPEMLSPYQQEFPPESQKPSRKLAPNLLPKTRYITHYRNLKFYLKLGCVLEKIHRVIEFTQHAWLAKYIDFNTKMRAAGSGDFSKDFFKLMNNAVFGKTQENLRNRISVEVITDEKRAKKRACKPTMKRSYAIHENLVIMEHYKTNLELNRPVYTGFCTLELSKLWMYGFHYDQMRRWFPNIELAFTDTDSLLYLVTDSRDVYDVMFENSEWFDFSEYPKDHLCYNLANKKVIGLFKDELHSLPLEEFIGLRPKCYSLRFRGKVKDNEIVNMNPVNKKAAKGTKYAVQEHLNHGHYRAALFDWKKIYCRQNGILSRHHSLGTYTQCKLSLTCFDTKRYIMDDGIHTLAHGHYMTRH